VSVSRFESDTNVSRRQGGMRSVEGVRSWINAMSSEMQKCYELGDHAITNHTIADIPTVCAKAGSVRKAAVAWLGPWGG
jgi:hypothetical protein